MGLRCGLNCSQTWFTELVFAGSVKSSRQMGHLFDGSLSSWSSAGGLAGVALAAPCRPDEPGLPSEDSGT